MTQETYAHNIRQMRITPLSISLCCCTVLCCFFFKCGCMGCFCFFFLSLRSFHFSCYTWPSCWEERNVQAVTCAYKQTCLNTYTICNTPAFFTHFMPSLHFQAGDFLLLKRNRNHPSSFNKWLLLLFSLCRMETVWSRLTKRTHIQPHSFAVDPVNMGQMKWKQNKKIKRMATTPSSYAHDD